MIVIRKSNRAIQGGMIMDIAQLSMDMAQTKIMNDVSMAVLDKTMDIAEVQSSMMTDLLESASPTIHDVNPAISGNIDVTV